MGLKRTEQEEYAKHLYTEKNLSQKEIAQKVGVTEKTLTKWINANDGAWKKLKRSLTTTKAAQIKSFYDQLERLNQEIENRKIVYDVPAYLLKPIKVRDKEGNETLEYPEFNESDYPIKIGNFPTSKESDSITKITNAIQKLEGEASIGETVNIAMDFVEYSKEIDFEFSKKASEIFDMYIREKMK